jgi:hypothetical protein
VAISIGTGICLLGLAVTELAHTQQEDSETWRVVCGHYELVYRREKKGRWWHFELNKNP